MKKPNLVFILYQDCSPHSSRENPENVSRVHLKCQQLEGKQKNPPFIIFKISWFLSHWHNLILYFKYGFGNVDHVYNNCRTLKKLTKIMSQNIFKKMHKYIQNLPIYNY